MTESIYDFIKQSEKSFQWAIPVDKNWNWSMKDQIRQSILFKHGKFWNATNEWENKMPFRNIALPILNLQYRAEDIDVKDVLLYVDDPDLHHLSFLVKKYHDEVFVKEHDLDTLFDEIKEEKIDFGAALVRKGEEIPVFESLETICFCDQTNMATGPIGFRMEFSPEELYEKEKIGWGDTKYGATATIDQLVAYASAYKIPDTTGGQRIKTPSKYIEVYRVHGVLPAPYLKDTKYEKEIKDERYVRQILVCAYYKNQEGKDVGVVLYRAREYENPFMIAYRGKKLKNRALPYGGMEELFDPIIWTNYSDIQKKQMLDAASKIILKTTDATFANRNKVGDMDNLEIAVLEDGKDIGQVDTYPRNMRVFDEWINEWQAMAQDIASAHDPLMGKEAPSGTPFRAQERQVIEGKGTHEYRRGKYAKFIEEMYNKWIIPLIVKKIMNGSRFLSELSADEMEFVADKTVRGQVNKMVTEKILNGELITQEEIEQYKQTARDEFVAGGNKRFIEILKGELKSAHLKVKVNVAGKQKNLASTVDSLTNVFRQIFASPGILNDPRAVKIFNKILEYSGLDPVDFATTGTVPTQQLQQMQAQQFKQAAIAAQPTE